MNEDIKVSVICTVYNHEKYLRRCLDGFVMQKTNFAYEVWVHDDASKDGSAMIIKEYAEKYPDIIKPIIQIQNQYSQGIVPFHDIILPVCAGKYIAVCEGDDYWCSEDKLQIQYDFMEQHEDCSMCVHNTIIHDLLGSQKDKTFYQINDVMQLTEHQIFFGWGVHTSSYFMHKQVAIMDRYMLKYFFGDYIHLVNANAYGKVYALPQTMSVYNINNTAGMTYEMLVESQNGNAGKVLERKQFLEEYNEATNGRFSDIIRQRIAEIEFAALKVKLDYAIKLAKDKRDIKKLAEELTKNPYYPVFTKELSQKNRIYHKWKYEGYVFFPVWWASFCLKSRLRNKSKR